MSTSELNLEREKSLSDFLSLFSGAQRTHFLRLLGTFTARFSPSTICDIIFVITFLEFWWCDSNDSTHSHTFLQYVLKVFREGESKQFVCTMMMALQGIRACLDLICLQINHSKHFLCRWLLAYLSDFAYLEIFECHPDAFSHLKEKKKHLIFYPLSLKKIFISLSLSHRELKYPQGRFW